MKTKSLFFPALLVFTLGTATSSPSQADNTAKAASAATGMVLRAFNVPPDFLSRGKGGETPAGPAADPFAGKKPKSPPPPSPARRVLESLGVNFSAEGSSADFDKGASRLTVRNTTAQLDLVETLVARMTQSGSVPEGLVQLEVFSLPPLIARKALMAHPKEASLYAWLDAELEKKDSGVRLERNSTVRVRGGQRSKSESIDEFAYPTEFDPPQISQNIGLPAAPAPQGERVFSPWPVTATTPQSFQFRNTGWTVEVELTLSEDSKTADLNLAPESVCLVGMVPHGLLGEIRQPVFETQKCSTQVSMSVGQPTLVSTFSPPMNTGVPGGNKSDRVWLLFVTVTRPQ